VSKTLSTLAKSGLILAGGIFGLLRSLRILENLARNTSAVTANAAAVDTLQAHVDTVHLAVARLGTETGQLQTRIDRIAGDMDTRMVTRAELDQALERAFGKLERGVDDRFEHQSRSVEALRVMVGQTDELLQRVLDGLEATRAQNEELDLTHARG
jgi:hypothetical protein